MKQQNNIHYSSDIDTVEISLTREKIDEISKQLALFHNSELRKMFNLYESYKDIEIDVFFLNIMRHELEADLRMNKYLVENKFNIKYMDVLGYYDLYEYMKKHKTITLKTFPFRVAPIRSFNLELIERHTKSLYQILKRCFIQSLTYDEFIEDYCTAVDSDLKTIHTTNDYACIRFAADICLSSFEFWSLYFFSKKSSNTKKKESLKEKWNKLKENAKELVKKVQPYAEADLEGAAWGALVGAGYGAATGAAAGAVAGGVGAVPGAISGATAGAVDGAFQGAIAGSLAYGYNHR